MKPATLSIAFAAADDDGISVSQTPGAAGNLTITGALASGGVATLATAPTERQVLITSAADESGTTFVVYGTNGQGIAITDTFAGGAATAVSTAYFRTVNRISISAAASGAVKVGTNGLGGSQPWQADTYDDVINIGMSIRVTGTINVTVQYSYVNFNEPDGSNANYGTAKWWDLTALASKAADTDSSTTLPALFWRLKQNSFSTGATAALTIVQSGPQQ